ncbi:MAG: sigma-E factor regulatory protein RseB [Enterobacteriaceae bacterium]
MKNCCRALCLLLCSLWLGFATASEQESAEQILQDMGTASRTQDYQLSFITINKTGVEILRYTHVVQGQLVLARLLQLDGPRREITQRGDQITFFETGLEPFTLTGKHIVDAMPGVVFADFAQLSRYYDFMRVGQMRVADRDCDVIRIIAKDGTRYSYVIWVDEQSKLLLRAELLDTDGETLEQFRVVSFSLGQNVSNTLASLLQNKPTAAPVYNDQVQEEFAWNLTWLPKGFKEISHQLRILPGIEQPVQSRLYSDGLFSFSVNVLDNVQKNRGNVVPKAPEQAPLREGRRTIFSAHPANREITVIGELPVTTAKRIAGGITWRAKS